jgi:hypothetical protein
MNLAEAIANVIRWVAGVSGTSPKHGAKPKGVASAELHTSDLVTIGSFSLQEFETLRGRMQFAGVAFWIECDTGGPGINGDGGYNERQSIQVYVHEKQTQAAAKIINQLRLEEGGS